jgi:hypothetical protein
MRKSLPVVVILLLLHLTFGVAGLMAQQPQKDQKEPKQQQEQKKEQKEPKQEPKQPEVGSYQAAPKNDPAVEAAAKAAVSERQQKEGGDITLVSIKRAETQLVAGINYRLCLKVKAGGKSQTVTVVINKTLNEKYSLTTWQPGGCKKI